MLTHAQWHAVCTRLSFPPTKESLGLRLISLVPSCLYGLNLPTKNFHYVHDYDPCCVCLCLCACMSVCICVCTYVCMCVYVCVLCWKLLSNTVLLSTFSSILYDWLVVCIGVLQNRNHLEFV